MAASSVVLPEAGFVRIQTILAIFPVSKSTWYAGIALGKYPAPVKLSERTSAWRVEDIRSLLAKHGVTPSEMHNVQPGGNV